MAKKPIQLAVLTVREREMLLATFARAYPITEGPYGRKLVAAVDATKQMITRGGHQKPSTVIRTPWSS